MNIIQTHEDFTTLR